MGYDTDGNLAALRAYEREQDALEARDEAERESRQELSDKLFDGYASGNTTVIDEVNARLVETDATDNLLTKLQKAMQIECTRPVMGRGPEIYDAYMKIVRSVCDEIAEAYDVDDIIYAERDYDLL